MSKFDTWFKAQFGQLPLSPRDRLTLDEQLESMEEQLDWLRAQVRKADRIAAAYHAAQYAKNAAPSFKVK